jgi:CBS domain-containing protein
LPSLSEYTIKQMLEKAPSVLYSMNGEEPIILAGVHLSALEVEAVASLSRAGRADGIILGYCVLRLINAPNLWSVFYKTKISTVKLPVLMVRPQDNLQRTVSVILNKGWGYAVVVDSGNKPTNLIGLLDLAAFYLKSGVASGLANMRVKDKASNELFTIGEDATVIAAIRTMLERHTRRLFVKESGLILSDRGVIKWLLSASNMTKLRDSPKEVLTTRVSSISEILHTPSIVDPETDGATALELITKNDAHCVITKDLKHILTPWDLTVRLLAG